MNSFIARKYPFFADIDIRGLANTIKVHPVIIAGKLQYHTKNTIYLESIWFHLTNSYTFSCS
jgi:hypothetical protein